MFLRKKHLKKLTPKQRKTQLWSYLNFENWRCASRRPTICDADKSKHFANILVKYLKMPSPMLRFKQIMRKRLYSISRNSKYKNESLYFLSHQRKPIAGVNPGWGESPMKLLGNRNKMSLFEC